MSHQSLFADSQRVGHPGTVSERTPLDGDSSLNAIMSDAGSGTDPGSAKVKMSALNRVELIERIKRGNSPSWSQLHNVSVTIFFCFGPS